jgi:hypothetical protein
MEGKARGNTANSRTAKDEVATNQNKKTKDLYSFFKKEKKENGVVAPPTNNSAANHHHPIASASHVVE